MMKELVESLQGFFFPCYCIQCEERLEGSRCFICPECFEAMPRYAGVESFYRPWERIEGHVPFTEYQSDLLFTRNSTARRLIHKIKYNGYPELGRELARLFAKEHLAKGHFQDVSAIVPIPLALSRLRKRGYNQSTFIAQGIADVYNLPIEEGFLARREGSGTQTTRKRRERWAHLDGLFYTPPGVELSGRRLLIVDDLLTTGATLVHATKPLREAGVESLSYYTLAVDVFL